ncbi:MAG: hypothetical protein Alpg2KO_14280 [Alphaproteobacteria bacterium]
MSKTDMTKSSPATKKLVVLDFDNTLWDHLGSFERGIQRLIADIRKETGCSFDQALDGITKVNTDVQAHMCPAIYRDHPELLKKFGGKVPDHVSKRLETRHRLAQTHGSKRFEGVLQTIAQLRREGARVVMFTEAKANRLVERMAATGVGDVFDDIWCKPADSGAAAVAKAKDGALVPMRVKGKGLDLRMKIMNDPSPKGHGRWLQRIMQVEGVSTAETVMVGDNLVRDVKLAQDLGVTGIFAGYGHRRLPNSHPFIRTVPTNWVRDAGDMFGEADKVKPDAVLKRFGQLVQHVRGPKPPAAPKVDRRKLLQP